jgi:hypothetical protein
MGIKMTRNEMLIFAIIIVLVLIGFFLFNHFVIRPDNLCGEYGTPCNLTGM